MGPVHLILTTNSEKRMPHKILIVEDDLGIRETLVDLVQVLGFDSIEASNGQQALDLLQRIRPNIILSDIMMPVMDGIRFLKILKRDEHFCTIPVIILTARTELEERLESYKYGADGYLTKPFNMTELAYLISNQISLRENLIREIASMQDHEPGDDTFLQRFNKVLDGRLHNASLEEVALDMQLSKSGLQKKLKRYSEKSFQDYVRIFKLVKAKSLLEAGKCNVTEAANRSGFKSLGHFSQAYKDHFGISPSHEFI